MDRFLKNLVGNVKIVSTYLATAVSIIETFLTYARPVVDWVSTKMDEYQPLIDDGTIQPDDARELIVEEGAEAFHGSGPVVQRGDLRTIIDQLHKIREAGRKEEDPYTEKEKAAVEHKYIYETKKAVAKLNKGWV